MNARIKRIKKAAEIIDKKYPGACIVKWDSTEEELREPEKLGKNVIVVQWGTP